MSTRRAKRHQWIVANQKAVRYLMHHKTDRHNIIVSRYFSADCRYASGPRWRAIGRVQTDYERMVSVLHLTGRNLPQGKTEPPGLLQFVKAPFEPVWETKEGEHEY